MSTKTPKQITILVVPEPGGAVHKFTLKGSAGRLALAALTGFLSSWILLLGFMLYYRHSHVSYQRSSQEIQHLHTVMGELHSRLESMEGNLDRLASFDAKLRVISQLRDPDRRLAMGPLPTQEEENSSDSPFDEILPHLNLHTPPANIDELAVRARQLEQEGTKREVSMAELTDQLRHQQMALAATPATWPLRGRLTSNFGIRISPFTQQPKFHAGLDIAAAPGTPVYAPGNARVAFVGSKDGYGKTLILDHGYGILTCFAHNSEVLVHRGETIKRGQVITRVGNTGRSTGPHLHYEVRVDGTPRNPTLFILN